MNIVQWRIIFHTKHRGVFKIIFYRFTDNMISLVFPLNLPYVCVCMFSSLFGPQTLSVHIKKSIRGQ